MNQFFSVHDVYYFRKLYIFLILKIELYLYFIEMNGSETGSQTRWIIR